MIAWLVAPALAQVTRTVNVCVDYQVSFTDAVNSASVDGIGDHWDNNTVDRAAIGLAYTITTTQGAWSGFLDTAGCVTRDVQFAAASGQTMSFGVQSSTRRRGVDIHDRYNDSPTGPPGSGDSYAWQHAAPEVLLWTGLSVPSSGVVQHTLAIAAVEGWQVLAVATWLIHRSGWNLTEPVSIGCCTDGPAPPYQGAGPFGWCYDQAGFGYKRDQDPYLKSQPKIFIMGTWDVGTGNPVGTQCCGSRMLWSGAPAGQTHVVGFQGGVDEMARYTLAHELGHVLVGIRMGGREDDYAGTATLDGCNGSYNGWTIPPHLTDPGGGANVRGLFTKEYNSTSAREGWADWVSAWAWNAATGPDCEFRGTSSFQDFDLDGDMDNDFTTGQHRDGSWDCLGTPELFVADSSDPTGSFLGGVNWLADVIDEGVCDPVQTGCSSSTQRATMESRNRSTVYDWHRMLYQLYKEEGLTPEELSDIYVDMCPRSWRSADGDCSDGPDLPLKRWEVSGAHHQLGAEVQDRLNRVQH